MRNSQNVALFVDVNNFYHASLRKYGKLLDYKKFIDYVTNEYGNLKIAYAYGVANDERVETFKSLLRHAGYECRWIVGRYNWNVGIAMDVVRQLDLNKIDLILLGSGDPFLAPCADYVRQQGLKCYAYGFMISDQMRKSCDRFVEIPDNLLIEKIEEIKNDTANQP